jgi:hypothetical protein
VEGASSLPLNIVEIEFENGYDSILDPYVDNITGGRKLRRDLRMGISRRNVYNANLRPEVRVGASRWRMYTCHHSRPAYICNTNSHTII